MVNGIGSLFNVDERNIQKHYTIIRIPKQSGKTRLIHIPDSNLRRAQKYILRNYLSKFKAHKSAFAYRKGTSIRDMLLCHLHAKTIIHLDIKDFFPSITEYMIRDALEKKINNHPYILISIINLTTVRYDGENRLPQGAITSPYLSNIVFYPKDKIIYETLKRYGLTYTRYADDIVISSKRKLNENRIRKTIEFVRKAIKPFELNERKTKIYQGTNRKICGIQLDYDMLSVPRSYRKRLRAEMHRFLLNVQQGNYNPHELQVIKGKIAWIQHINPEQAKPFLAKLSEIEKLL